MKLYVCKNYDEMSAKAASVVASVITLKPDCVLGLATGSTPVGMYTKLAEMNKAVKLDFAEVKTYNLDEYYPIKASDPQSYRYFMDKNLFDNINIDKANNTHLLNGEAADADAECAAYDKAIEAAGGIDIQVLGIGNNGHIGFNEPSDPLVGPTHKTGLTESTIEANSRFFASADEVPKHALTMGMAPIMKARKIIMLVSGKGKHAVLREMLSGVITTKNPATLLNLHDDVTVVCDEEAYNG
ncbi:MAG: glucosamine-6-phosphate deaminase [Clostridia bacterium]|nr:glucosamine-6-phosphate deaminase [Clostridia bacterium]